MSNGPQQIATGMNAYLLATFKGWRDTNAPAWQNETIRQDIGQWLKDHDLEKAFEEEGNETK